MGGERERLGHYIKRGKGMRKWEWVKRDIINGNTMKGIWEEGGGGVS